jgi:PIN domain nuclease of toxin-antitoxin system
MRVLLDTHAIIWHVGLHSSLSEKAVFAIENPLNQVYISTVSLWEMALKISLRKLTLRRSVREIMATCQAAGAILLPVMPEHALAVETLPWHHRDPFDRMLIAQAAYEDLTLVTQDAKFAGYSVPCLW